MSMQKQVDLGFVVSLEVDLGEQVGDVLLPDSSPLNELSKLHDPLS